jgi:SPP1 gp7 family putative phage head morphogenesis protein
MWPSGLDDVDFSEAIDWFLTRTPMTRAEWDALAEKTRKKAFTVSGIAQLDLVEQAWRAVDKAIAKGTTLADFKKEIGPKLTSAWGGSVDAPASRVETIFRTNVQVAYSAGRYAQHTDPDVLESRPVWMFDAILDGRTSPVCKAADGTVLPADDPFWQTHVPPLHHRCRSTTIALTEEQAKEKGFTTKPTSVPADKGFGSPPGKDDWSPDPADYPPELWKAHEGRPADTESPVPAPPAVKADVADKLDEGTHIQTLVVSNKWKKRLPEITAPLASIPGVAEYLEKHPVPRLEVVSSLRNAGGDYLPSTRRIRLSVKKGTLDLRGETLVPGETFTISRCAKTETERVARTFTHETGHFIHMHDFDPKVDAVVKKAWLDPGRKPLTRYASEYDPREYFAESFSAYTFHREVLKEHDPVGFTMVEDVLRLRGILK